jgi:hypothetical protein
MNKFSEKLFNQELPPIVPGGLPMNDSKQPLSQNNSPNQESAFTQNTYMNCSPASKNEKDISK